MAKVSDKLYPLYRSNFDYQKNFKSRIIWPYLKGIIQDFDKIGHNPDFSNPNFASIELKSLFIIYLQIFKR